MNDFPPGVIIKQPDEQHFDVEFPGAISHRIFLPFEDNVDFKLTKFEGKAGNTWTNLKYPWDEIVYVVQGSCKLTFAFKAGAEAQVSAGGSYRIQAGREYTVEAIEDIVLICVFMAVPGGPPVDSK